MATPLPAAMRAPLTDWTIGVPTQPAGIANQWPGAYNRQRDAAWASRHVTGDDDVYISWTVGDHDIEVYDNDGRGDLEDNPAMLAAAQAVIYPPSQVTYPINRWSIVDKTSQWGGGNLIELLEFLMACYDAPLTAELKGELLRQDPTDNFDYIKNAQVGQPLYNLMGNLRHYEGFDFTLLPDGTGQIELNLGS